jgi:hypothetical protein
MVEKPRVSRALSAGTGAQSPGIWLLRRPVRLITAAASRGRRCPGMIRKYARRGPEVAFERLRRRSGLVAVRSRLLAGRDAEPLPDPFLADLASPARAALVRRCSPVSPAPTRGAYAAPSSATVYWRRRRADGRRGSPGSPPLAEQIRHVGSWDAFINTRFRWFCGDGCPGPGAHQLRRYRRRPPAGRSHSVSTKCERGGSGPPAAQGGQARRLRSRDPSVRPAGALTVLQSSGRRYVPDPEDLQRQLSGLSQGEEAPRQGGRRHRRR